MKKIYKLASLLTIGLLSVNVIACKQLSTPVPEIFIEITGNEITGTEDWMPESEIFVSGRAITIRNLLVSDHEVTQGEYEKFCIYGEDKPNTYGKGDNFPAYYVNWYDAIVYCNLRSMAEGLTPVYKLGGKTDPAQWSNIVVEGEKYCGPSSDNKQWNAIKMDIDANGYRLPTEAEWEYLAREGQTDSTKYSGSDIIDEVAWYDDNSDNKVHEVKTKNPNALGLYDMSGNVWEWCWDCYGNITESTDEMGVNFGTTRCQRGGSWRSFGTYCTVAERNFNFPFYRFNIGFRVVRTAK